MAVTRPLVVIAGPTGIGKTTLAVALVAALASQSPAEIISADSRQIYRTMDIGTAKPSPAERAAAPHHLIDIVNPDQTLSMAEYQAMAYAAIDSIHARGKIPLLVGGTGQYITAVLEGWRTPEVPPNPVLRAELEGFAAEQGAQALFERLRNLDPESGARMDPYNVRRTIRALEVCIETGRPFSAQRQKQPPLYRTLEIGLTIERESLYTRLDARIDQMMADGLLDEVRTLHEHGYDWRLPSMSGLGYRQLGAYLRAETTLDAAITAIKHATHLFVRRQYTWFRQHGSLQWLDGLEVPVLDETSQMITRWLENAPTVES